MSILLPILPGALPPSYCFTSWPQTLLDFANAMNAVLPGATFFNYGDTKPAPEYQTYPWLRTTDMRWYEFVGVWRSPNNYSPFDRRLFPGTLVELETYDGGTAGTVSPTSGPMWIEDTDFQGRSPMGPGAISGADPAKTLAAAEAYGAGSHALTEAEGGVGVHTHAFGKYLSGAAGINYVGSFTVPSYTGAVVQGLGSATGPDTTANLFTLPSGSGATGVPTPTAFSVVHPVRGCYVVKPSGRQFFVVP